MSGTPNDTNANKAEQPSKGAKTQPAFLHRVCIQCNNVFRVPAEKFDAKQCPKCHKS